MNPTTSLRTSTATPLLHLLTAGALLLAACGPKALITETRMATAPAREPGCALEFVAIDITDVAFGRTWEVLGYVGLADRGVQDPASEENRRLVRPRACAMGGTTLALAASGAATDRFGQTGSGLTFMVLRPRPATTAAPTAF